MNQRFDITSLNAIIHYNRRYWKDIALAITLSSVFFVATYKLGKSIPDIILDYSSFDRWYEGDIPRVYENMTWREGDYGRIKVHPLFALCTHPFVYLIDKFFGATIDKFIGASQVIIVRIIIGFIAFMWMFALFLTMRVLGCRRLDTTLFCVLAATSAASMFWFTVPETFSFGSLSILLALLLVLVSQERILSPAWYILINILTFGFVVTNWMAGILATFATNKFRRALHIIVYSFAIVTLVWGIQKHIYPSATFFIGEPFDPYNFTFVDQKSGGPIHVASSFFYHTLIMPAIQIFIDMFWNAPTMLTQFSTPGSGTAWGRIAVALWFAILSLGMWALFTMDRHKKFRIVLGTLLLGQFLLHVVYGSETFLCSLHFIILLILLAALGSLTRFRKIIIILIIFLIPLVTINNLTQFNKAKDFIRDNVNPDPNARHKCLFE